MSNPRLTITRPRATVDPHNPRVRRLVDQYEKLHWGVPARVILEVDDPVVPDLAEMGRLVELWVVDAAGREAHVLFPVGCHLGVERHEGEPERLWIVLDDGFQREVIHLFDQSDPSHRERLSAIARRAGGTHGEDEYPRLPAVCLGTVKDVIYLTEKKGDNLSDYKHAFGEDTGGPLPLLAADEDGRLWLAGGNYTVPDEGITD